MAQAPAQFDGTLIAPQCGGVWVHPGAAQLLGPELSERRSVVELVGRVADRAAAGVFTVWQVERATLLFGSGAMPAVVPHPGDLDLVLRIRHRPTLPERAVGPAQVQARVAPVSAAFLRAFCLALADEGARFLRLVTIWDGPFAGASRVPADSTVSWSLPAVACGRLVSAVGAVTLQQAAFECGVVKVSLLIPVNGRLMPVEVAIESSFVCPGGACDVAASFTAFWFGKVAFTEAEALTAAGQERELATLFPDRYSSATFAWETIVRATENMVRRLDFRKIIGVTGLLHAIVGDAEALEDTRRVAASPGAELVGFAARLSSIVKHRCARELGDADSSVLLADLTTDVRAATDLPGGTRWLDALSQSAGPGRLDPEHWADADRLAESMYETGLRHLVVELQARPRVLAVHEQGTVVRSLAAIPPPDAD